MAFLKRLAQRWNGEYRFRERTVAPKVLREIERGRSHGDFQSVEMEKYFTAWTPYLQRMPVFGNVSRVVGKHLAYKLMRTRKSEVYPTHKFRGDLLLECFGQGDFLDYNGIRLAKPQGDKDAYFFDMIFQEIVVPFLFLDKFPDLSVFFGGTPYEYGSVRVEPGDIVVDCGANVGYFSAIASHKGARVYSFEPSQYNLKYLNSTALANPSIQVCPYAVSDENKELQFFVVEGNIGATRDASLSDPSWGRDEPGYYEKVNATTLDDFIESNAINKVDFIKSDIEGAERDMLKGAKNILRRFAPKLSICTYHLPDDETVLKEIILDAQPRYTIVQGATKLYAWVE